jgi:Xaa-Pro aminopeptidase
MKVAELQTYLREHQLDAALFTNQEYKEDTALFYFAQTRIDRGALLVPAHGKPVLLIPGFEYLRIKHIAPFAVEQAWPLFDAVQKKLKRMKRVGVNGDVFSLTEQRDLGSRLPSTAFVDISDALAHLRISKTPEEQKLTAESCAIACDIMNACIKRLAEFDTEEEVAHFLKTEADKRDCELAFPPIVASGAHGATPHHVPNGKLASGFCVIDFGVRWKGYCSDMTRTVFLGTPTAKDRAMYARVLAAQENALRKLKAGVDYRAIDTAARKQFGAYAKNFVHGLGHSVGLWVHDIVPKALWDKLTLPAGAVWTVEPGLYFPNKFGIRIEDTALVTASGSRVLTHGTTKQFTAVKR